ncbi:MAG: hypothetical protein ACRDT1_11470 [Micromonosporaceae bacterium]
MSQRTAEKISQRHHMTEGEVREAVTCVPGLVYVWDDDPDRGLRALVKTRIRGRDALVVLYPTDDGLGDAYNLGSAYFID